MIEGIFIVPVAPKDADRAVYAVRSIRAYCKHYRIYLLLDGLDPASLSPELSGPDIYQRPNIPPSKGHWGSILLMQIRAMIEADTEKDISPDAVYIRMDCDSLIIRKGLIERAQRIFSTRPAAGQIGQVFSSIRGARRANPGWANHMTKTMGWRGLLFFVRSAVRAGEGVRAGLRAHRDYRTILKGAVANGYVYGDLCLNGCTVLRRELVARMAKKIPVETSPFRLSPAVMDDVIMTFLTYWLGFSPMDDTSDGGICGVEGKELRVDPFVLKERGHYVIHPLKYGHTAHGHNLSEVELVNALMALDQPFTDNIDKVNKVTTLPR